MTEQRYDARDILKLPNFVSATGLGLVANGAVDIESVSGVSKIAAGRGLDLVDGALARLLDQTSELGAAVDAVGDKFGLAVILASAWYHEAAPRPVVGTIAARHGLNTLFTNVAAFRRPEESLRPTTTGKLSMAADNVALFGYLYANAMEHEGYDNQYIKTARNIGRTAFITGLSLGVPATYTYIKRALSKS